MIASGEQFETTFTRGKMTFKDFLGLLETCICRVGYAKDATK